MSYDEEEQLTKKQRREEARAQRKALEAAEHAGVARRKHLTLIGGSLAVLVAAAVVVLIATSGGGGSARVKAANAAANLRVTPAPWAPEYNGLQTRLAALKFPEQSDAAYHVHAALRVFANGQVVPVPANIGIDPHGEFLASLHTHDASGVIHIESSERYPFTLGQFFTIWGIKFTNTQLGSYVAGNGNVLSVYVNGKPVANPVGYVMKPHDDIIVAYGKPGSSPASFEYDWGAAGL